ncbi:hypothetical protein BHM03_00059645, partial [Ensete ventricosum]
WGHWFTLRDLEIATDWFSKDNVLGEGGYGVVYLEVEAIGHVRHKNLVRLLGYCVEGTQRYVAPEYANTGLLNETSDIYSFGVLLLEVITGRDPVDYRRPPDEVHLQLFLFFI